MLLGRSADGIEQSIDDEEEYRIIDQNPITNVFIGSDKGKQDDPLTHSSNPNSASFLAGIIEGVLNSSKMHCKCYAHQVPDEEQDKDGDPYLQEESSRVKMQTIYVIKFQKDVIRQ